MSYDADVTCVIGGRGIGKTYGARLHFVRRYMRTGRRFVEICRTKAELASVRTGYFDKLSRDERLAGCEFRVTKDRLEMRREEGAWDACGYLVALTELQTAKKRTYLDVESLLLDEALIERIDRYHGYLPHEWRAVCNVVDSCTREVQGQGYKPHLYLLGNAVDFVNPYFEAWGIDREPGYGYSWHAGKAVLLHYVKPGEFERNRSERTLSGRLASIVGGDSSTFANRFDNAAEDYVERKRKPTDKPLYGIVYKGERYGVWYSYGVCEYRVEDGIPDGVETFALTTADNRVDMRMARRTQPQLKAIAEAYYNGDVTFSSAAVRERFGKVLSLMGVRM